MRWWMLGQCTLHPAWTRLYAEDEDEERVAKCSRVVTFLWLNAPYTLHGLSGGEFPVAECALHPAWTRLCAEDEDKKRVVELSLVVTFLFWWGESWLTSSLVAHGGRA